MAYLKHPYLIQDFWINNRYWKDNEVYSKNEQKS